VWNTRGVEGVHRFLARSFRVFEGGLSDEAPTREQLRLLNATIKKVGTFGYGRLLSDFGYFRLLLVFGAGAAAADERGDEEGGNCRLLSVTFGYFWFMFFVWLGVD
jgi:hypothetical protein